MKRILITGSTGFIGTALCKQLLAEGWRVRGTVRSTDRIPDLVNGVEPAIVGSIGPNTEWSRHLVRVDAVVHLAAKVHDRRAADSSVQDVYMAVNAYGSRQLAEASAQAGVGRFVYLSTLKVNGDERDEPYSVSDPVNPIGPYAQSKRQAEKFILAVASGGRWSPVILRPPLVYGPGVKANFLQLFNLVNRGVPLPLAGIDNQRSLIYMGNLVDAILAALTNVRAPGRTYLVADAEPVSTPGLVRRIAVACGRPQRLFYCPPAWLHWLGALCGQRDRIRRLTGSLVADTDKTQAELRWQPRFDLAAGLDATAGWYLSV